MVHIADIFSESFSLIVEVLSEIISTPLGTIALSLTILCFIGSIFRSMRNCVNSSFEAVEVSEPEPEVKEVPKQQIEVKIKSIKEEPQLVICNYCGTKHKAEDKICSTCNAVLPLQKK